MDTWRQTLNKDPLDWLLEPDNPAVRHRALRWLLDEPEDSPEVRAALAAAMATDPISTTLAAQDRGGYWVKPGPGYSPKYTGTVWSLIFLDQAGADPNDERIREGCAYVLEHTRASCGGFGYDGANGGVVHCLNGNLLAALIRFGWLDDERVRRVIDWQAASITGDGPITWFRSGTTGPGFRCRLNGELPCAWGAIKALRGLATVPLDRRSERVRRAIEAGVDFLFSIDPASAAYPADTKPSPNWFKFGFPSGYIADILQILEVLADLGLAGDSRLAGAVELVLSKQDGRGRWANDYGYADKTWVPFEAARSPSKWVTLRACRVLKAVGPPQERLPR
jgi:hypothetical protein